jgi:phospholipase/carboxylesterase
MAEFIDQIGVLGLPLLRAVDAFEKARRQLHPPHLPRLREALAPIRTELQTAAAEFAVTKPPPELRDFARAYGEAAACGLRTLELFCDPAPPDQMMHRVLQAMHEHSLAQEKLYALRLALPPVSQFFLEPPLRPRLSEIDPQPPTAERVGLLEAKQNMAGRGGFSLYVPESYDPKRPWPLVVALHGGSGDGRDFIWTWLREARGRGFLLLSPTSQGPTWALMGPDVDHTALLSMVEYVLKNWTVDRKHVLLTGLSDGATYTLLSGLRANVPFTALAPVSGVFHPANGENGNLGRARGKRIYLVHGGLDWMFPIEVARAAAKSLRGAGADLTFREIEDLSHTYPREENDRILTWFDPSLALPPSDAS